MRDLLYAALNRQPFLRFTVRLRDGSEATIGSSTDAEVLTGFLRIGGTSESWAGASFIRIDEIIRVDVSDLPADYQGACHEFLTKTLGMEDGRAAELVEKA